MKHIIKSAASLSSLLIGVSHVMCWGMLDHHSWLQSRTRREDGMLKRCCPYDPNYQPKLLRQAIAQAFRNAPMRG